MAALVRQLVLALLIVGSGCGLPERVVPDGPGDPGDLAPVDAAGDGAPGDPTGPEGDAHADAGPDAAVDGPGVCSQQQLKVTFPEDDGEIDGEAFRPDGEKDNGLLHMGWYSEDTTWSYFRFTLPQALPPGTQVSSAVLALFGSALVGWDSTRQALLVRVELSADADIVLQAEVRPDSGQSIARPVTEPVRWPAQGGLAWLIGGYNSTPDLSAIVQAVIDASSVGLAKGAHLQLWITGERYVGNGEVTTPPVPGLPDQEPRLTLEFCSGEP